MEDLLKASGVESNDESLTTMMNKLEGKSIPELIAEGSKDLATMGGGGGGAPAAGGATAEAAPKEEAKVEEEPKKKKKPTLADRHKKHKKGLKKLFGG